MEGNKKKFSRKTVRIILVALVALLLAVYIGFGIFFNSHFFFGTRMESIECSLQTVEGAQKRITKEVGNYTLEIIGRDGITETISEEEIGLVPVFDSSLAELIEAQNGFSWPTSLFSHNVIEIPVEMKYSEDALKELFDRFRFFDSAVVRKPKNAYIGAFDKENKLYQIVEEDKGTVLIKELTYQKIKEAISNLDHQISLDELSCYILPEITSESAELLKEQQELNKLASVVITYQFGDVQEVVDGELIADWMIKDEDGTYHLDPDLVREYINSLARKYDTFGQTREFRNSHGELLTMRAGSYGWWMDRSGETEELMDRIVAGESGTKEVKYHGQAVQYGDDDIGDSYVEIDLTNQHLYLYIAGEIILESDFVSGNVKRGYQTPTGVFGLTYKERNTTLNGQNYSSPVNYWMPFNGNVGMHDAKWRNQFGGNIYVNSGSHGCINLPYEKAKEIYSYVDKWFPVIVYGGYVPTSEELEQQRLQWELEMIEQQLNPEETETPTLPPEVQEIELPVPEEPEPEPEPEPEVVE